MADQTIFQCRYNDAYVWMNCRMHNCVNERRINPNVDPIIRLQHYKGVLDSGSELSELEQEDLEAIAKMVVEVIERFVTVLREAFSEIVDHLAKAITTLWDSLPPATRKELAAQVAPPLRFSLGVQAMAGPDAFQSAATRLARPMEDRA